MQSEEFPPSFDASQSLIKGGAFEQLHPFCTLITKFKKKITFALQTGIVLIPGEFSPSPVAELVLEMSFDFRFFSPREFGIGT